MPIADQTSSKSMSAINKTTLFPIASTIMCIMTVNGCRKYAFEDPPDWFLLCIWLHHPPKNKINKPKGTTIGTLNRIQNTKTSNNQNNKKKETIKKNKAKHYKTNQNITLCRSRFACAQFYIFLGAIRFRWQRQRSMSRGHRWLSCKSAPNILQRATSIHTIYMYIKVVRCIILIWH